MQTNITIDPIPLEPKPAPTSAARRSARTSSPRTGRKPEWLRASSVRMKSYWESKKLIARADSPHRL